jgi:hypothetical protein
MIPGWAGAARVGGTLSKGCPGDSSYRIWEVLGQEGWALLPQAVPLHSPSSCFLGAESHSYVSNHLCSESLSIT